MNQALKAAAIAAVVTFSASASHATTLTEVFADPFPAWESDWLATNSNIQNYYGAGANRGNQPLGLWVQDTDGVGLVDIKFDTGFGAQWSSFAIDVATFVSGNTMTVYDISNNVLGLFSGFDTRSYSNAVTYQVTSTNGIGGFSFSSSRTAGSTWIDNVTVSNDSVAPVPLPASALFLFGGLAGLAATRKRAKT